MCEDKTFITLNLKRYVMNWYHMYIFHPELNITEVMVCQFCNEPALKKV